MKPFVETRSGAAPTPADVEALIALLLRHFAKRDITAVRVTPGHCDAVRTLPTGKTILN